MNVSTKVNIGKKHAHKLKRINIGTAKEYLVYRCFSGGCSSYYIPKAALGVLYRCWKCNEDFVFTARNLRQTKVRCENCIVVKDTKKKQKIDELTASILAKLGNKQ